ncbi:hypothetical protein [Brevibacterium linens]|uniref:DNA-3-methyladenine glycosylase III n=1 Tax=Brevibacterium linens TaxID=1703 RepID=A0A2H1IKT0_BRELN|nr:hypothetical protein [Brevibacterium linens]SMX75819.1 DNA-3-methyladenine glycosylase III [Brevibacterium linens]
MTIDIRDLYDELRDRHGDLDGLEWWPMPAGRIQQLAGAILVQRNRFSRVELSLAALGEAGLLDTDALAAADPDKVAALIRPSGLVRKKAPALVASAAWLRDHDDTAAHLEDDQLYRSLRRLPLVGPESADVVMMYSYHRARHITDEYARRLYAARGLPTTRSYQSCGRALITAWEEAHMTLAEAAAFHALIVTHAQSGHLAAEEAA